MFNLKRLFWGKSRPVLSTQINAGDMVWWDGYDSSGKKVSKESEMRIHDISNGNIYLRDKTLWVTTIRKHIFLIPDNHVVALSSITEDKMVVSVTPEQKETTYLCFQIDAEIQKIRLELGKSINKKKVVHKIARENINIMLDNISEILIHL